MAVWESSQLVDIPDVANRFAHRVPNCLAPRRGKIGRPDQSLCHLPFMTKTTAARFALMQRPIYLLASSLAGLCLSFGQTDGLCRRPNMPFLAKARGTIEALGGCKSGLCQLFAAPPLLLLRKLTRRRPIVMQ
jgi:hypothetical protein